MDASARITRRALMTATGAAAFAAATGTPAGAAPTGSAAPTPGDRAGTDPHGRPRPYGLLTDLMRDPLGVAAGQPRLTWIVAADRPSARQVAYQVQVAGSAADLARSGGTVFDSGRVASDASVSVPYPGPALAPSTVYHWRVRTWSGRGPASAWSSPQRIVTEAAPAWPAEPVWAPDGTFTLTDGRLDVELTVTAVSVGLFLRARGAADTYLWQVVAGSPGRIKPHVRRGGQYTVLKEVALPVAVPVGTPFTLSVELAGDTFRTYVDGALVDTTTDTTAAGGAYPSGTIGFRNGRTETQRVHRVRFTDPGGRVLVDEDFTEDAGVFTAVTGGAPTVDGGDLVTAVSQELLASLGETREWAALRTAFTLPDPAADPGKAVTAAVLYATGRTPEPARQYVYRAWVNGTFAGLGPARAVGDEARYATHDVTALVRPGRNALAALCWAQQDQRFLAQLVVCFADGTRQVVGTGPGWKARRGGRWRRPGGGLGTGYYAAPAEPVDARHEPVGWLEPGYDDADWPAAETRPAIADLRPTPVEPVTRTLVAPVAVARPAPGVWRFDLGREIVGGLRLALTGAAGQPATAGQRVEVRLGEELQPDGRVRYQLRAGNEYRETWRLRDGAQEIEHWGYRGFRWAELVADPALDLTDAVRGVALKLAWDDEDAAFASSSPDLDRVWRTCRYSVEATRLDVYQDTPTRERGPYEGDALVNQRSEYATQRSYALARYSAALLARRPTWPCEYRLMPVLLAWADYLETGDDRRLAADYDVFVARNLDGYRNAAGLVEKAPGGSSQPNADLVDWPAANRDGYEFTPVNTVVNAWQYAAYATLARVAGVLGRTDDATTYALRAGELRAAVNGRLLDRAAGRYRDGAAAGADGAVSTHAAQHATAFAVALGVADDPDLPALGGWLATGGVRTSVYGAQFLLDALYRCGRADAGYAVLTGRDQASWLHMIDDLGATVVMEAWDPAVKPNTTFSHAWASAPANVVAGYVAGVSVLTPGGGLIRIAPQPGPLAHLAATVPTIRGPVRVALSRPAAGPAPAGTPSPGPGPDGLALDVDLPPNAEGRIELDLAALGVADPATLEVRSAGRAPGREVAAGRP